MPQLVSYNEPSTTFPGRTETVIFLEPPVPTNFALELVGELHAIARPVGLGVVIDLEMANRPAEALLRLALREAGETALGRQRHRGEFYFDYVAGKRVKVWYYPTGLERDADYPLSLLHPGWAAVLSAEFDGMHGDGCLERIVRLALSR